ncbi:phospholipase A [Paraneptunicella aestuarii]|uniref:phospholipase A n=1 Tax=Paraneptunicella aestuarii TaxID=2831148 RepID=UPI001E3A56F0|nr:phospholipase A [Paraneptunicella aestuarii]
MQIKQLSFLSRLSAMLLLFFVVATARSHAEPLTLKQTSDAQIQCVMNQYKMGQGTLTLTDIRKLCEQPKPKVKTIARENPASDNAQKELANNPAQTSLLDSLAGSTAPVKTGAISERMLKESQTEFAPYVITPHKMNYILPAITTSRIHKEAYSEKNEYQENLEDIEAKFQLSLKVPLNTDSLFIENDGLYFGFTLQAWWQIYADNISKPFRESNYTPELFYIAPLDWHPFGGNTGFVVGFEHQSNGRTQELSRSWNRVYGHFLYEKDDFALSLRPWYRMQEEEKESILDPSGDDNPDINDYMGHFELGMVYKWSDMQFSFLGRQNFATHKGAAEIGLTFPIWGKLRGYATAFTGYGESLIDYNYSQTRFGIGIALNDVL